MQWTFCHDQLWNIMERGLMKSFGRDGRSAILLSHQNQDMQGGVILEKVLYKYVVFFRSIHRRKNGYFAFLPCGHAVACEKCCIRIVYQNSDSTCPICRSRVNEFKKIFF